MQNNQKLSFLIVEYYRENPNTSLTAFEVAELFNFCPEQHRIYRAKAVRDLKRIAKGSRCNTSRSKYTYYNNHITKEEVKKELEKYVPIVHNKKSTLYKNSSRREDLKKGELQVEVLMSSEPKSPEEIIAIHKVDTTEWNLVQYWSKEKSEGWQVSALFAKKKTADLTIQDLKEVISETFETFKISKYNLPKVDSKKSNKKGLFVYLSDKHVGALTKSDAIYDNEYNKVVFAERLHEVYYQIKRAVDQFGVFEDIYICDLGDSVDGWSGYTTRGGHQLPQNMNNKEVFKTFVYEHKNFFDNLLQSGMAVNYHTVIQTCDNHGGDFSNIVNEALALYLNTAYPEVEVIIMDKFLEHFYYGHHCFIFTHGKDTEDLKNGLPLVLTPKAEVFIKKYIDYFGLAGSPNIHLIKGDLHTESTQVTCDFRYRNVLSMYGASKWIMNNFGPNFAGVSFDVVEKHSDFVYSYYTRF